MRVPRVFVADLAPGLHELRGREAHHLASVLRVAPGARVRAFDGQGLEAEAEVLAVEGPSVRLSVLEPRRSEREASLRVTLAVALLKGDKLADVVRMGTELGVAMFRPFTSQRTEVPALSANKLSRLRRVAREAAKQSGRSVVPEVCEALPLSSLPLEPLALVAHPRASARLAESVSESGGLTVITGPEGGFTDGEVEALQERGARAVRLGERILRAETAPVAVAAALLVPEAL